MSEKDYRHPFEIALDRLENLIESDESLDADTRVKVLNDLESESPAQFVSLRKILAKTSESHATDKAHGE